MKHTKIFNITLSAKIHIKILTITRVDRKEALCPLNRASIIFFPNERMFCFLSLNLALNNSIKSKEKKNILHILKKKEERKFHDVHLF